MQHRPIFKFGPFLLYPHEHLLLKAGKAVNLSPQLFSLLVIFVENANHLLTKQELRSKLWGAEHYVSDDALKVIIGNLRKILDDGKQENRYIENIFGKGYRFICSVTVSGATDENISQPVHSSAGAFFSFQQRAEPESNSAGQPAEPVVVGQSTQSYEICHATILSESREAPVALATPRRLIPSTVFKSHSFRVLLAASVLIAAIPALTSRFFSPRPSPLITRYTQLTHEGHGLGRILLSDDVHVYFDKRVGQNQLIGVVSLASKEEPVYLSIPLHEPVLAGIFPAGEGLLVGQGWPPTAFWKIPLPAGSPQPLEKISGEGVLLAPNGRYYLRIEGDRTLTVSDLDGLSVHHIYSATNALIVSSNWSPSSRMICFIRIDPEAEKGQDLFSIWAVNADGSNLRKVVSPDMGAAKPSYCSWTSDEKHLLFSNTTNNKGDLWAIPDGMRVPFADRKPVQLTNTPVDFFAPVASHHDKMIFAQGSMLRGELVRYDKHARAWLPFLDGISAGSLDFSRNGKWVAYVRHPEGTLWRSRVDGTEPQQLTFPPYTVDSPHWSPDGQRIAYRASIPGQTRKIYLISAEGGVPEKLLSDPNDGKDEGVPTWSADGRTIVFGSLHYSPDKISIHKVDVSTRQYSQIPGSQGLWTPRWSPDGRFLLALTADSTSPISKSLMLFDFSTCKWKTLLHDAINDPAWSHDGRFIYFNTGAPDPAVKRVRRDGSGIQTVVDLKNFTPEYGSSFGLYFGVAPDGSPLMLRKVLETEIYKMDVRW